MNTTLKPFGQGQVPLDQQRHHAVGHEGSEQARLAEKSWIVGHQPPAGRAQNGGHFLSGQPAGACHTSPSENIRRNFRRPAQDGHPRGAELFNNSPQTVETCVPQFGLISKKDKVGFALRGWRCICNLPQIGKNRRNANPAMVAKRPPLQPLGGACAVNITQSESRARQAATQRFG